MKRFIAFILIFILVFSLVPISIAEEENINQEETIGEVEEPTSEEPNGNSGENPTTYTFNVTYNFYGDWNSEEIVYSESYTKELTADDSFSVENLAKTIGYDGTGYECREWFCGSIEVVGGDSQIGTVEYEINYTDFSLNGEMVPGPVDIIYNYSPYNDYLYMNHYLQNDNGEYELAQTKRYAGYMYDFSAVTYSSIFLEFEGYEADTDRIESGNIRLRKVGEAPLTLNCYYNKIVQATPSPTPTPEATSTPTPTPAPTAKPTKVSTPKPTACPTIEPTEIPTTESTIEPTIEPTALPIAKTTIEPTEEPIIIEDIEDIEEVGVPLGLIGGESWALINLICMILTAIGLIKIRKEKKYNIFMIIIPIISILIFVFTEHTCYPMTYVDKYTGVMVLLFVLEALMHFIVKKEKNNLEGAPSKVTEI